MSTPPTVKLTLYLARRAPLTLILRQGPTDLARLILWDRAADRFEDGQWLKARVYPERCALSADGAHFLFAAYGHPGGTYAALSRPPWFTALGLWDAKWHRGTGVFLDARRFAVDVPGDATDRIGRYEGLERVGFADAPATPEPPSHDPKDPRLACKDGRLFVDGALRRDFRDMGFEPLRAPYDWRPEGWDPLRP